jgi:hypothetical protein
MLLVAGFRAQGGRGTAMSNRCVRILAAGGAMALVAALGVPMALAAATVKTWTVQPGGAIMATARSFALRDTITGTVLSCGSSRMSGRLTAGSGLPGAGIGSITAVAYRCPAPTGGAMVTPRGLPWRLNLTSYKAAAGVVRGTVSGFKLTVFIYPDLSCHPVINGTSGSASDGVVTFTYIDKTGMMTISPAGGNLHWYHVQHCLNLVKTGDPATFSATYTVSPKQAITSP